MDHVGVMYGSCMGEPWVIWVMHGSYMGHVGHVWFMCVMYGSRRGARTCVKTSRFWKESKEEQRDSCRV